MEYRSRPRSWVDPGDGAEQRLGVRVPGPGEQHVGRRGLDDPAGVHDQDPVGPAGDHAHVVGDQQQPHVQPGLQLVQQPQDLGLDGHVERGGRLVGDQQLRLAGQRHRDHHALAQAAGQLVRVRVEPLGRARNADQAEDLLGPPRGPAPGTGPGGSGPGSAIWSPIVMVGFRLVIGSWNTMATCAPRTSRISVRAQRHQVLPGQAHGAGHDPPGLGSSRMIDMAVIVLPQPDSPTRPTVSPCRMVKDTVHRVHRGPASGYGCGGRSPPAAWSPALAPFLQADFQGVAAARRRGS